METRPKEKYFSQEIVVDSRCYQIEVRQYQGNRKCLVIGEPESGNAGPVVINEPQMIQFMRLMNRAFKAVVDDVAPVHSATDQSATTRLSDRSERRGRNPELPSNTGAKWTPALDQELTARFESGQDIGALAAHFNRTTGSIRSRLKKLGLITWP